MNCEVAVKMNPAANFSHVLNNVGVFNGSVRACSVQSSSLLRTVWIDVRYYQSLTSNPSLCFLIISYFTFGEKDIEEAVTVRSAPSA